MLVAVIDNYDSFTFNLVHYILYTGVDVEVFRNDQISVDELEALSPGAIVISPGPGRPEDAGISLELIRRVSGKIPLLGVCLGHQAIGQAFGADIIQAGQIMHGKTSMVTSDGQGVFTGMNKPFSAMRYHSLAISKQNFPEGLIITAETEDGEIMGVRHRSHPTHGVQFHPESFMTTVGKRLIRNFIKGA